MSDSKLSLVVQFLGQDKLSGALRNIIGLGKSGDQALRGLNREAKAIKGAMKDASAEIARGTGNVTALIDKERQLARELDKVNDQIERQKKANAYQADTNRIRARGDDLQSRGTDNLVGAGALAAPLVLAGKAAMDFSSGMVDIQQKAELSNAETERMRDNILNLARVSHQLPEDMRAGVDALAGFGLDPRKAVDMIGPIGRLGTAFKVDLADGAGAAFANLNNLKVPVSETARALDIMAAGGKAGAFEVRDMARWFPQLTAQMQTLGAKGTPAVADLTAALQVAMNTAGSADEAANNIANLLGKINSPTTINAFEKKFGYDLPAALKTFEAQGMTSMEAFAMAAKQATGGDMKKLGFIVEDRQAQMGLLALIQNMDKYRSIREQITKSSGGTVDAAFAQREAQDASIAWMTFKGTMSELAITLGANLLPTMSTFFGYVNTGIQAVSSWARANPALASTLMTLLTGFVAAKAGLGILQFGFGSFLNTFATARTVFAQAGTIFGVLRTAVMFLAQGVMRAGMMMLANPVVLAIVAIVAVIGGAAYLIYRYWDQIKQAFSTALNYISGLLDRLPGWAKLLMALSPVGLALLVWKYWDRIKLGFANGVGAVRGILTSAVGWFKTIGGQMMDGLLLMLNPSKLAAKLLDIARAGVNAFKNFFGIKSPSRLFMQMGGHMTTGLSMGIDRGGRDPLRSMGRLAAGVAGAGALGLSSPGIAGPGLSAASRPNPAAVSAPAGDITINIYQQPGENAEALAERIDKILRKRKRGGFGDDGFQE